MKHTIQQALALFSKSNNVIVWEMIKQSCIKFSKKYSIDKAKKENQEEKETQNRLALVTSELMHVTDVTRNSELSSELVDIQSKLEVIRIRRVQSVIFRSKLNWAENGERNTKYFFNLEKSRYKARNISCLQDENDVLQTDNNKILQITAKFYQKLYTEDNYSDFTLKNTFDKQVTEMQNVVFSNSAIDMKELGEALVRF